MENIVNTNDGKTRLSTLDIECRDNKDKLRIMYQCVFNFQKAHKLKDH